MGCRTVSWFINCGEHHFFSSRFKSRPKRINTTKANNPVRADVPGKLSHRPVSSRGPRITTRITGKIRALDTESRDAGRGLPIASMQL